MINVIRDYLMLPEHMPKPDLPIYVGQLPPEPAECISITESGMTSEATFFGSDNVISTPLLTCTVRTLTYPRGRTNCAIIRELLKNLIIGNLGIVPGGNVMHLGRDEQQMHIFRLNIKTIIKE